MMSPSVLPGVSPLTGVDGEPAFRVPAEAAGRVAIVVRDNDGEEATVHANVESFAFLEEPCGARVRLSPEGLRAARDKGLVDAVLFVPLARASPMGFAVVVEDNNVTSTKTIALGVCTALPGPRRVPESTDDAPEAFRSSAAMVGFGLAKFIDAGKETKLGKDDWCPRKELQAGDRVELLLDGTEMVLRANGVERFRRTSVLLASMPPGQPIWGVVDLQGTVSKVQLCKLGTSPPLSDVLES